MQKIRQSLVILRSKTGIFNKRLKTLYKIPDNDTKNVQHLINYDTLAPINKKKLSFQYRYANLHSNYYKLEFNLVSFSKNKTSIDELNEHLESIFFSNATNNIKSSLTKLTENNKINYDTLKWTIYINKNDKKSKNSFENYDVSEEKNVPKFINAIESEKHNTRSLAIDYTFNKIYRTKYYHKKSKFCRDKFPLVLCTFANLIEFNEPVKNTSPSSQNLIYMSNEINQDLTNTEIGLKIRKSTQHFTKNIENLKKEL